MVQAVIYWIPELDGIKLAVISHLPDHEGLAQDVLSWRESGIERIVCLLERDEAMRIGLGEERAQCEEHGIEFTSFPIRDRSVPNSLPETVLLIHSIERYLREGKGVGIHCRLGIGRTGLIAACVLVNLGIQAADAFALIRRARGVEVPDTDEQYDWLARYVKERHYGTAVSGDR